MILPKLFTAPSRSYYTVMIVHKKTKISVIISEIVKYRGKNLPQCVAYIEFTTWMIAWYSLWGIWYVYEKIYYFEPVLSSVSF